MSRIRRSNPQFFNFRRWTVLCLGVNPKTGSFCITGEDHQAISKAMYFGSLDICNEPVDPLSVKLAAERLGYHSHKDLFVLIHETSWSKLDEIRALFENAARQRSDRTALAFGMLKDGSVWVSQDSLATKPKRCPNWDPTMDFQMPDGNLIPGLRICDAEAA